MRRCTEQEHPALAPYFTRAAQVTMEMECSASELRWLWALQGVLGSALVRDL